jgi:hypothetical protein
MGNPVKPVANTKRAGGLWQTHIKVLKRVRIMLVVRLDAAL